MSDAADLDSDGDTAECTPTDLDASSRFADVVETEDTGCGMPVVVDMGAYEHAGVAADVVTPGDIDGDGFVLFPDLLGVLSTWGPAAECALADFDLSGVIDFIDLLTVLANWG